jgi:hypothetical protein
MTVPRDTGLPEATISELDGVRYLHLDTPWVQGAMHIRRPRTVVLEYVRRMLAWMLWRPQEALVVGHAVRNPASALRRHPLYAPYAAHAHHGRRAQPGGHRGVPPLVSARCR